MRWFGILPGDPIIAAHEHCRDEAGAGLQPISANGDPASSASTQCRPALDNGGTDEQHDHRDHQSSRRSTGTGQFSGQIITGRIIYWTNHYRTHYYWTNHYRTDYQTDYHRTIPQMNYHQTDYYRTASQRRSSHSAVHCRRSTIPMSP